MKLLDAINNILPHLGENPVTTSDSSKNPTVAIILDSIEEAKTTLITKGWWFNERTITLFPSSENEIFAPTNVLAFYPTDGRRVEIRADKMYDLDNGTFLFTEKVEGRLVDNLTFEELPTYAALVIQYKAAISVYTKDFGPESTIQVLSKGERESYDMLMTEHLRKRKFNSVNNRRGARFINALRS